MSVICGGSIPASAVPPESTIDAPDGISTLSERTSGLRRVLGNPLGIV